MSDSAKSDSNQPMFVQFARALSLRLEEAGIEIVRDKTTETGLPQNKGWVRIELAPGVGKSAGQKAYIPQAVGPIRRIESTLDLQPDLRRGVMPLPKPRSGKPYSNGKIRSHLVPDVDKVASLFIDAVYGDVPPPVRRPAGALEAAAEQSESEQHETVGVHQ